MADHRLLSKGLNSFDARVRACSPESPSGILRSPSPRSPSFPSVLEAGPRQRFPPIPDVRHLFLVLSTIRKPDRVKTSCFLKASCTLIRLEAPQFECTDTGGLCCID